MELYQQYTLHHAGSEPGRANTTRVNLWFDADPVASILAFFEHQCDAQAIQGIVGTISAQHDWARIVLIIDNSVDVQSAASSWISCVNKLLTELPEQILENFSNGISTENALAVSGDSSNGVTYGGDREY